MPTLERKYLFAEGSGGLVLEWLASRCFLDPDFQRGTVNSLYYDSPDFKLYHEKRGSDFLKAKVRLRWYGSLVDRPDDEDVACFLELKEKEGARRHKGRLPVSLPVGALRQPFRSDLLRDLPARLLGDHPAATLLLHPLMVVSYHRSRFVEPAAEARLSVDTAIACPGANPMLLPCAEPVRLTAGVLETKSPGDALDEVLYPIRQHLQRAAFSKYASLLEAIDQPLGVRI